MSESQNRKRTTAGYLLCGGLLLVSLLACLLVVIFFIVGSQKTIRNAIVVDAGSSSSKTTLFSWTDTAFRTNADVKFVAINETEPGVSAQLEFPEEATKALNAGIVNLTVNMAHDDLDTVPIFLAATAGMRLALLEDPTKALQMFEILRVKLRETGLKLIYPMSRVRLLSGMEEGLYGWVSVNNLLGHINETVQAQSNETVGSIDLGGASTQISYAAELPSTTTFLGTFDYTTLTLFEHRYEVYSQSFLCFGLDQAENRSNALAIDKHLKYRSTYADVVVANPCMFEGYSAEIEVDEIYKSACVSGNYAENYLNKITRPTTAMKWKGTGNYDGCKKIVKDLFGDCEPSSDCHFDNKQKPALSGSFQAYSGFTYIMQELFGNQTTDITLAEMSSKVKEMCETSWNDINATFTNSRSPRYCWHGVYVMQLLENYGFVSDELWKTITFSRKINGDKISWAPGYMLDQIDNVENTRASIRFPLYIFIIVLIISIVSSLIAIGSLCYLRK